MNRTYRILPIYTSDVSGVCSALYELGALTVMHDPSGCNSTYNTHDEIRWYEKDSLIFISGLTERDAVMGNDEKFYRDVLEAAQDFRPRFIAITNSPIPYLMSTDFKAISSRLERETGIPSFYVPANGMHDYICGASEAFRKVTLRLTDEKYRRSSSNSPLRVNVLGLTPLDFAAGAGSILQLLKNAGFDVISSWAMDTEPESIARAGEADVNLVVSSCGLSAAKVLKERFGTPYVAGAPTGALREKILRDLERAAKHGKDIISYMEDPAGETFFEDVPAANASPAARTFSGELILIGEPVTMGSLGFALRTATGRPSRLICPLEIHEGLLRKEDIAVWGEEETEKTLAALSKDALADKTLADIMKSRAALEVIADPLYKLICPEGTIFHPLPHLALSGRIYLKDIPDLAGMDERQLRAMFVAD